MAGDWIKMRTSLQRSPRVVRIASALKADRLRVIGGLHAVWSLADEQTEEGRLDGVTFDTIDEMIGWKGFCAALEAVDWAAQDSDGVTFPRFEKHNGRSAKRRAQEADRKRSARASASKADARPQNVRPREEKRREKEKQGAPPDGGPVWTESLAVLTAQGIGEKSARAFLGLLCREHEESDIVEAVKASVGKANATAYIRGVLKGKTKKGQKPELKLAI